MCTVNIKIDNEKVRRINPNLKNNENIERWVQYCMDEFIDTLSSNGHKSVSPNARRGNRGQAPVPVLKISKLRKIT